jgi:hypothetical protein
MGRTLHYEVINHNFIPTDKQQLDIYTLTEKYCKEFDWTCETPDFDYYRCYPNWDYFDKLGLKGGQSAWEYINKSIRNKISSGMHMIDAIRKSETEGIIKFLRRDTRFSGFTKVGGNELNAHALIKFIVECSHILRGQIIGLYDEGDALYAPLHITEGMAMPDINLIIGNLDHWEDNPPPREGPFDVSAKEKYYKQVVKREWEFGDINQFIRPINASGYLAERKEFKTTIIEDADTAKILEFAKAFLVNEKSESGEYYDDIKSFPNLKTNAR